MKKSQKIQKLSDSSSENNSENEIELNKSHKSSKSQDLTPTSKINNSKHNQNERVFTKKPEFSTMQMNSQVLRTKELEAEKNINQLEKEVEAKNYIDEPILLLNIEDSGKVLLSKKAMQIIKSIKTNIAIICVVGPYRTGKSFLLNRFLGIY